MTNHELYEALVSIFKDKSLNRNPLYNLKCKIVNYQDSQYIQHIIDLVDDGKTNEAKTCIGAWIQDLICVPKVIKKTVHENGTVKYFNNDLPVPPYTAAEQYLARMDALRYRWLLKQNMGVFIQIYGFATRCTKTQLDTAIDEAMART